MADEEEESMEEGAEGGKKKKKKGKIVLIIPVVVLLLGGGGFFGYRTFLAPHPGSASAAEDGGHGKSSEKKHGKKKGHGGEKGGEGGGAESEGPAFFSLSPFVVNLQDNIGTRYLKLTLKFELEDPSAESEVKAQLPKIRDALIILLSSKNYAEIGSVEGKYRLREEIVKRVNRFLEDAPVRGVYFTDFVIQ